ncbi:PREDICTED: transcription factor bHLH122-like [Fragaria vesca subsp. vesca]
MRSRVSNATVQCEQEDTKALMRRTQISERMRKLWDLFPNMDKQTNTAQILKLAVQYIKDLQKEVKLSTIRNS